MLKEKRYIIVLIAIMVAIIMLKPNFSNAATEYKYSDTEQGIEWGYELDENNNVINLYCATKTKIGKVEIPSTIDGKKVISLQGEDYPNLSGYNSVLNNCKAVSEVIIPDTITEIPDGAFYNCVGLKSITILNGNSSLWGAFGKCTNLEKVLIPDSVVTISKGAFLDCPKLTIYGNDGMKSKEYAEANEINFDYIANWDKANDGADVTPPSVEKIEVARESIKNCTKDTNKNMYIASAGTTLTINVQFSEIVEGSEAPVFTIKFGDMDKIELNNGVIGGSIVSYNYKVKENDKGALTSVSLNGGNLKDAAGNKAVLTAPAIYVQYSTAECVYANGTTTVNTDNENKDNNKTDNNQKDDNNKDTNNNNNNNNQSNNNDKNNQQNSNNKNEQNTNDDTKAKGELPHTGAGIGIVFILTFVTIVCAIVRNKYNKLRDI